MGGIFRGVDSRPGGLGCEHADRGSVFESAKLLQLFAFFERRLLPFHKIEQKLPAIGVDSKMAEARRMRVAIAVGGHKRAGMMMAVRDICAMDEVDGRKIAGVLQNAQLKSCAGVSELTI